MKIIAFKQISFIQLFVHMSTSNIFHEIIKKNNSIPSNPESSNRQQGLSFSSNVHEENNLNKGFIIIYHPFLSQNIEHGEDTEVCNKCDNDNFINQNDTKIHQATLKPRYPYFLDRNQSNLFHVFDKNHGIQNNVDITRSTHSQDTIIFNNIPFALGPNDIHENNTFNKQSRTCNSAFINFNDNTISSVYVKIDDIPKEYLNAQKAIQTIKKCFCDWKYVYRSLEIGKPNPHNNNNTDFHYYSCTLKHIPDFKFFKRMKSG
ncbi:hypothetical protein EDEG_03277 [Edhazardia aedis USNM 41457]|uniref:Uncharacterized protein n=1 Tax=Edhazardia aedis (strain USNM 41457) TaxID=1003232 RepID=J8ZRG1_EDHAE|nr:hypothetical protein EDEG_03277 [Edhazardia aedis USNM 41457]|eukprot:EJW02283.1 hypothetical protein EDEG_03277 [Edhazardia aedis USNM 41457]